MHTPKTIAYLLSLFAANTALGQTVIVDNGDPGFSIQSGTWNTSAYGNPYGVDYNWASCSSTNMTAQVEWRPTLPQAGEYEVAVHYVSGSNRADNSPFTVNHATGTTTVLVNQQINDSTWVRLGEFSFDAGTNGSVTLGNNANPTVVIADAVRFRPSNQFITADDPRIEIGGSLYSRTDGAAMRLDRIDPAIMANPGDLFSPAVAVLTTGVTIRFCTDSPTVRAYFNHLSYVVTEGTGYVVYQDGVFNQLVTDLETVDIATTNPGYPVTYEIVCPSYDEVTFSELELEPGSSLCELQPDRRLHYFAFGDSISHGAEIDADTKGDSTRSYPWILASAKGWHLYNLAVGGSKVTPAFGNMLTGRKADIITILWGTNDIFKDNNLPLFTTNYQSLLDNLRMAQPFAPIYCITMITAASEGPGSNGYTLNDYREAVAGIVAGRQNAGDCRIHLVRGEQLTTLADLSDGTHLSVPGAASFAAELSAAIGPVWGDFNEDGTLTVDDWTLLANCAYGPGETPLPEICENYDNDCDNDIDLQDFAAFMAKYQ